MSAATVQRPVMRYHGGKYRLAPWIVAHFPRHRVYTESYCGAASVLLHKPRVYAEVLNDLDGEIVNVFAVLRNPMQARELERGLRLTPYARAEFELAHLPDGDPVEQARRTIVRACMGYGSSAVGRRTGFRTYSGTERSASPGQDWANYPDAIPAFVARLQGVYVENIPAIECMRRHDAPDTLHYVDPPYVHKTRTTVTNGGYQAYRYEMTDQDHCDLAAALHSLKGMVVLSGYASPLYAELYAGWACVTKQALADGAKQRVECLWFSPAAAARQQLRMEVAV